MTPFSHNETIATEHIAPYVAWIADQGVTGLFILGTWGGFPLLSFEERKQVGAAFAAAAREYQVSCVVNIGTPCLTEAEALARHAEAEGATAIASTVPFYHSGAGYYQLDDYRRYFDRLRNASSLPLFLYNNPRTTGVLLSAGEFVTLVEDGLAGVKDGSKDVGWIIAARSQLRRRNLDATIIPGNTTAMLYAHSYGLEAVTSGAAVTFPALTAQVFQALRAGDDHTAARLHGRLLETRRAIAQYGHPAMVSYALLEHWGMPTLGQPRLPWRAPDAHMVEQLGRQLEVLESSAI